MEGNSKLVASNQSGIHPDLKLIVTRHLENPYSAPHREFSSQVIEHIKYKIQEHPGPVIMDSGCGTGESTVKLAGLFPDSLVIGVDKSLDRINETPWDARRKSSENYLIIRGDLIDVWRLMAEADVKLTHHFILYPNPWPKKKHVLRRWHGHPVFPHILALGGTIHLRTNWQIYAREFEYALNVARGYQVRTMPYTSKNPISPFERKYSASNHTLFELLATPLPAAEIEESLPGH